RGPLDSDVDGPVPINSFGDFERIFGGLDPKYPLSYAVRDFYLNGGAQAVIVRLYKDTAGEPKKATIKIPNLALEASSPGTLADKLGGRVDTNVSSEVATRYGLVPADLFNLTVRDMDSGQQESFLNLSVKESPRRADRVLKATSSLAR